MKSAPIDINAYPSVSSGLITVHLEIMDDRVILHAPLSFDGETVADRGQWAYSIDPNDSHALSHAICDAYLSEYDNWCNRNAEERAITRDTRIPPAGTFSGHRPHTPCPVLWAGR